MGEGKKESDSLVISQTFLLFYTSLQDIIIELFKTITKQLVSLRQTIIKNLLALITGTPALLRCS